MSTGIDIRIPRRRSSPDVSEQMAAEIKTLLAYGVTQHDIAARYRINQGRVSEIKKGRRFPGVAPAPLAGMMGR